MGFARSSGTMVERVALPLWVLPQHHYTLRSPPLKRFASSEGISTGLGDRHKTLLSNQDFRD